MESGENIVKKLSDETLLETYHKARQLGLDKEFILLLEREIQRRNLQVDQFA